MPEASDLDQAPREVAVELDPAGPLDEITSVFLWAAGLGYLGVCTSALRLLYRFIPAHRVDRLTHLYTRGQVALTGSRYRRVIHPDVDPEETYAFFCNHVNLIDHCTMYDATPHFKQGVELIEHFEFPFYGPFMKARGTIPVVRGSASGLKDLMQRVRGEVKAGRSLLIFPEGTRTTSGRVGEFQPGVFRIISRLGIPIVPVSVTGMYEVMHKDSHLIRPGHEVTVYCDRPIETKGLKVGDVPDLMRQVHDVMSGRVDDYWRTRGKLPGDSRFNETSSATPSAVTTAEDPKATA